MRAIILSTLVSSIVMLVAPVGHDAIETIKLKMR